MTNCHLNFNNQSTDSRDMKSVALVTWHLVHVPMVIYSKGDLLYCILQLKAWYVGFRILKIRPQTAEIWNQVPWPRGIWSTCPWSSTVRENYSLYSAAQRMTNCHFNFKNSSTDSWDRNTMVTINVVPIVLLYRYRGLLSKSLPFSNM